MEQLFREAFPRPSPLRLIQVESSQYLREYDLDWGRQEEAGVSGMSKKISQKHVGCVASKRSGGFQAKHFEMYFDLVRCVFEDRRHRLNA